MKFTKMHGLGNDYLYVYGEVPEDIESICRKMSDRHFGAGSDGMIFISPSEKADFKMRIFNADGSEAKMCGNGIRCAGKYLYDKGYTSDIYLRIETLAGIKDIKLYTDEGKVVSVLVNMGKVSAGKMSSLYAGTVKYEYIPVDAGNPHAVIFVPDAGTAPIETAGPLIEKNILFPGGVNAEFATVNPDGSIRMRVWERGSGITMACGTGACAVAAAAAKLGYVKFGCPVSVILDGGILMIEVERDGTVLMSGPAETVYEGEMNL